MVAYEIFAFLHLIGLAFGLGGATIATIISIKVEGDKNVARAYGKIIPSVVSLIWIGLVLLIISGIALPFYIKWELNSGLLILKHIFVAWIIVIGFSIGWISRKVSVLAPIGKEKPKHEFLKSKGLVKVLSMINLFLWYFVTFISVFV